MTNKPITPDEAQIIKLKAQVEKLQQERNNAAKEVRNELLPKMTKLQRENEAQAAHIKRIESLSIWGWLSASEDDATTCESFKADVKKAFNVIGEGQKQSLQAHDYALRNAYIDEFIAQLEAIESPPTMREMRKTGKAGGYTCEQEAAFGAGVHASIEKLKSNKE